MSGTNDYRTITTDAVLRRAIDGRGDRLTLTLDPAFQGLPDIAHGGSVLAAFDAVAARAGPREVAGVYRRRVPLGVPLALEVTREPPAIAFRLLDDAGSLLADGRVAPVAGDAGVGSGSGHPPRTVVVAGSPEGAPIPERGHEGHPLPVSARCFACGTDNPLGLRCRLSFDAERVWLRWTPREGFRAADGSLAPVALTALLDETAFWLGALASGESGMTTDLRVSLRRTADARGAITVAGERARVRRVAGDARYWATEAIARDATGAVLASAQITFVAVRGAARRLVTGLLAMNSPEVLRRVFPAYAR